MKSRILGLLGMFFLVGATTASAVEIFYQEGFSSNIYRFDSVGGTNTLLGTTGGPSDSFGMAFAPNGTLYAHDRGSQSLYTLNTSTGAATLVGASGIGAEDFTVNLAGTLGYATDNGNLYSINLSTGAATSLGSLGGTLDGLTTAPVAVNVNGTVYAAGSIFGVDTGTFYLVDVGAVSLTNLGSFPGTAANETLDFGPDGTLYGHNSGGQFSTIGLNPIAASFLGNSTPNLVFGMAVRNQVPVPATLALLGIGLFGLVATRRRKP